MSRFGKDAIEALTWEYTQLEQMKVFKTIPQERLIDDVNRKALRAINIIQEKNSSMLNGRTCVDGSKPQIYDLMQEVSSPF